ncbi:hypothetical protein D3C87_1116850 [compost metagenome]
MEGKDREIGLLIQLSSADIESWLYSKGYTVIQYESYEDFMDDENISEEYFYEDWPQLDEESNLEIQVEDGEGSAIVHALNRQNGTISFNSTKGSYKGDSNSNKVNFDDFDESYNYEPSNGSQTKVENLIPNNQKKRLISYVSSDLIEPSLQMDEREEEIQLRLLSRRLTLNYEKKTGRNPTLSSEMEEDYDVISCSGDTEEINRYIKVFGFSGEWNNYGVLLSSSQMKKAKVLADRYWLYIVEFVGDEQHVRINRIQDPYNKITNYVLDYGWRAIAETNNPIDKLILGTKINHHTHGLGVIKGEVIKGKLKLLIVDFESGEKKIPINVTQIDILED